MELTRVIHPIGQGGFYTETFKKENGNEVFNVVYDCGGFLDSFNQTKSAKQKMENYLQSNKTSEGEVVVFISHLHEDHINGLEWLLKHTNVKYLFLPQLTDNVVLEFLLYNMTFSHNHSVANSLILKIKNNDTDLLKDTKVIQINSDFVDNSSLENAISLDGNNSINSTYPYRTGTIFQYKGWLYIPFNSPAKPIVSGSSFYDYVKDKVNNKKDFKIEDVESIYKNDPEKCKKAYKDYFGKEHNTYSMPVFSGLEPPFARILKRCCWPQYKHSFCCNHCDSLLCCSPNFLYTGDFEPNNQIPETNLNNVDLIKNYLNKLQLWDTISGIQVPHHGSRDNYNAQLYVHPGVGYISVGSKNVHKHPNVDTLVNIQKERCWPIVVSEDPSSMQVEVYRFRD